MAKNSKDYSKGKIYCIRNYKDDDVYVGSTTAPLSKRMEWHRNTMLQKGHRKLYSKMMELGPSEFYIELIENYPCETVEELKKAEGEHIRKLGTLNSVIAGRTKKEYCQENKQQAKQRYLKWLEQNKEREQERLKKRYQENKIEELEKAKIYRKENAEMLKQKKKAYYDKNKERISDAAMITTTCVCGGCFRKVAKARHEKTQMHQKYIQQLN